MIHDITHTIKEMSHETRAWISSWAAEEDKAALAVLVAGVAFYALKIHSLSVFSLALSGSFLAARVAVKGAEAANPIKIRNLRMKLSDYATERKILFVASAIIVFHLPLLALIGSAASGAWFGVTAVSRIKLENKNGKQVNF